MPPYINPELARILAASGPPPSEGYFGRMMTNPSAGSGSYFRPMMTNPNAGTGSFFQPSMMRPTSAPVANQTQPGWAERFAARPEDETRRSAPSIQMPASNIPPPSAPSAMNYYGPAGITRQPGTFNAGGGSIGGVDSGLDPYADSGLRGYDPGGGGSEGSNAEMERILSPDLRGQNLGRRTEDRAQTDDEDQGYDRRADPEYEKRKSRLISAMEKYASYRGPERDKYERKPKRYDLDDLRKMEARERAGMEPLSREIEALQQILGITAPQGAKYEKSGDYIVNLNAPGGPETAWSPPAAAEPWRELNNNELVRPNPTAPGGIERILGTPPPPVQQRPVVASAPLYDSNTGTWISPPPGGYKSSTGGLPASVAGRAVDAGIPPVPEGDPDYELYQRIIAGTASKEEQALMRAANQQWARAYQDRLQSLGQYSFGAAPTEQDYADAETHANRVRSDYLRQAQTGVAPPGGPRLTFEEWAPQYIHAHPEAANWPEEMLFQTYYQQVEAGGE